MKKKKDGRWVGVSGGSGGELDEGVSRYSEDDVDSEPFSSSSLSSSSEESGEDVRMARETILCRRFYTQP